MSSSRNKNDKFGIKRKLNSEYQPVLKFCVDIVYGKGWYDAGVSKKFDEISTLLLDRFSPHLEVKGQMVKKGGLFEIYLNGEKLFSKVSIRTQLKQK